MSEISEILRDYGECSLQLARLLKEEGTLDMDEQISIENHVLIVQLALTRLKYGPAKVSVA